MRMGTIRFLAISLFILLSISQANGQYSQSNSPGAVAASRVVPLTIKVVLLGFSNTDLNSSYLTSGINSIPVKYQQVLQGPINTGVMYNFTYQYVYEEASSALVQSFARYVNSTGKEQDTVPGTPPPFFGNPALNKTSTKVSLVQNYFYDANKVENWLISNQTLFGAIPNPGYTLFISDLNRTIIPSLSFQQYQVAITKCSCNSTMAVQAHYYNRTDAEKAKGPKISTTLNTTMVQNQLASLLPFATVTVSAKFSDITAYPQLAAVVANATTKVKDPALSIPIVDARLVWNWLSLYGKGHMTQFINATHTTSQYDIPGFLFAFQGNYTFAFTFKDNIELSEPPGSIGGVALGDMILVNQSNSTLTYGYNVFPKQPGKGFGFTRATIHELGHMIGLNHPFIYDQTEDFTNSVMAYYPDSNTYSQFDKDTVLRGINDELLIIAQDALAATGNSLINSGTIAIANREMALANQHYSTMDYAGAVQHSLAAALSALQAEQSGSLFSSGLVFGLIGLAVGVAAGLLLGFLFFRKRKVTTAVWYNRCPTCQQPVRWDPVQMEWYCDRCQKPV